MRVLHTIAEMQAASRELRRAGKRLGLVPTMGALPFETHDGLAGLEGLAVILQDGDGV